MEAVFHEEKRKLVSDLLVASDLPVDDLDDPKIFLNCVCEDARPVAAIGVERYSRNGLLRSLVVTPEKRGAGLARSIVGEMEANARMHGLSALYVLTDRAQTFFSMLGYERVKREDVPDEIKATTQFTCQCPASATVMRKHIYPADRN